MCLSKSAALRAKTRERIETHPCYCEEASLQYARIHLAVAPKCNVQCNYCNRRYDCANESRPGVTSERLEPQEAFLRVQTALVKIPQLTVAGIAGPGDPLANPCQTFETFKLIRDAFPDLQLCLSTNGLTLPDHLDTIQACGIDHVTITINAINPAIGKEIYAWVRHDGLTHRGEGAAKILWSQQQIGLRGLVERDVLVKVNTVLIPGVNDRHIPDIARQVKDMGVFIFNIMPLIPVRGTAFTDHHAPTREERRDVVHACTPHIRIMRHCRQCRADAAGLLGEDRSSELVEPAVKCTAEIKS